MKEQTTLNRRIAAFAAKKRGKMSFQLIADRFGVSRNVVAGIVFRSNHPVASRVRSSDGGSRNKIGHGYRRGDYPEMTAQNSR